MKKISVGNVSYDVKMTNQKDSDLGDECRGKVWYEKLLVTLDKELPDDLLIQTFYHEIAHVLCESTSFNIMLMDKLGDNGYEIFVDNLGKSLYNLIHNQDMKNYEQLLLKEKNNVETGSKSKNTRSNISKD